MMMVFRGSSAEAKRLVDLGEDVNEPLATHGPWNPLSLEPFIFVY